jgi:hypothetical protein
MRVALAGRTKNISSAGVLFTAAREPDLGGSIEYVITLTREGPQPVQIRCVGKVLRAGPSDGTTENGRAGYEIAATLERYEFVRELERERERLTVQ